MQILKEKKNVCVCVGGRSNDTEELMELWNIFKEKNYLDFGVVNCTNPI